jgi:hypothetical protein
MDDNDKNFMIFFKDTSDDSSSSIYQQNTIIEAKDQDDACSIFHDDPDNVDCIIIGVRSLKY